jgi:hypothetical protein
LKPGNVPIKLKPILMAQIRVTKWGSKRAETSQINLCTIGEGRLSVRAIVWNDLHAKGTHHIGTEQMGPGAGRGVVSGGVRSRGIARRATCSGHPIHLAHQRESKAEIILRIGHVIETGHPVVVAAVLVGRGLHVAPCISVERSAIRGQQSHEDRIIQRVEYWRCH